MLFQGIKQNADFSGLEISDLMMALVAVFLLGSVMMQDVAHGFYSQESINRQSLDEIIEMKLGRVAERNNIELLKGGILRFRGKFESGESQLSEALTHRLDELCPALIALVIEHSEQIETVVFEGHTSKQWENITHNTAYYGNKDISDWRAKNTMRHCLGDAFEIDHSDLMAKFLAIGYSYSQPFRNANGTINWPASKRVDIKVHAKRASIEKS